MRIRDKIKSVIKAFAVPAELDQVDALVVELDDELDALATKIYMIRKVALRYSDNQPHSQVKDLSDEILEIIGNSPRTSNQRPN